MNSTLGSVVPLAMLFFIKWVTWENSAGDNDGVDGDNILWPT